MPRVIRFHEIGGPEVLRIEHADIPPPGAGEVRIRVKALGLNRAEALMRRGTYLETPELPAGLGFEAAGVVESLGDGVTGFEPGDAVSVIPAPSQVQWPAYGTLATFPARLVVRNPASLGWVEAAALWMAYVTAYGALVDIARLGRGEIAAITAASSSVGLAAIQIARHLGAVPVAITRTSAKKSALLEAGAAEVIASAEEDLEARLKAIAGPAGVRLVFDAVGGPAIAPLTAAMAHGGILIGYGVLSSDPAPLPLFTMLAKSLTLRGYVLHELTADPARLAAAKLFILDALASDAVKPVIARTFPFEAIVEAHRFMESNEQFGKIVVTV
jgi:NADPH:quinone reductase-like Zn-dependent oxidoreductase